MKRIGTYAVLGILWAGLIAGSASAAHIERLTESDEYTAVVEEADVVGIINDIRTWEDDKEVPDVTADEIDWSGCYRKYLDESDSFSNLSADASIEDIKDNMEGYWILPYQLDGVDSYITIAQHEQNGEMRWEAESISQGKRSADSLEEQLGQTGEDADEILYVGGTTKMRSAFAVLGQADGSVDVQLMAEPVLTGELDSTDSQSEEATASLTVDDGSSLTTELERDEVYSFSELASILNQYTVSDSTNDDSVGDGGAAVGTQKNTPAAGLIFVLVIVCGVGIFALRFRRAG